MPVHIAKLVDYEVPKGMHALLPCSLEVALERARARELVTKRHVPPDEFPKRLKDMEDNRPSFQAIVDSFVVIERGALKTRYDPTCYPA